MTLFRREVIERQGSRLEGNVSLALPVSWQAVGILMFCTVIGAFAFLLLGSYARTVEVRGSIQPLAGVARIVPSANGTLDELFVQAGEAVISGTPLALVRTGLTLSDGVRSSAAQIENLQDQERALERQTAQRCAQRSSMSLLCRNTAWPCLSVPSALNARR